MDRRRRSPSPTLLPQPQPEPEPEPGLSLSPVRIGELGDSPRQRRLTAIRSGKVRSPHTPPVGGDGPHRSGLEAHKQEMRVSPRLRHA